MRRAILNLFILSLLVGLSATCLVAQESGQMIGTVTDVSKAVVPNATVVVTSVGTTATRSVVTNSTGNYTVTNLQPGLYEVAVTASGFAKAVKRAEVSVGAKLTVDFGLEVGKSVTVVEVVGESGVA